MNALFKKLNLSTQSVIHVLDAPACFEPQLAALQDIPVKRSVRGASTFAMAFVITQAQLDAASRTPAADGSGDAILWMVFPKGHRRNTIVSSIPTVAGQCSAQPALSRCAWSRSMRIGPHCAFDAWSSSRP
jgi:hypothetical protein